MEVWKTSGAHPESKVVEGHAGLMGPGFCTENFFYRKLNCKPF